VHIAAAIARMRSVVYARQASQGLWARDPRPRMRDLLVVLDAVAEGWNTETTGRAGAGLVAADDWVVWGHGAHLSGWRGPGGRWLGRLGRSGARTLGGSGV
jgi:hypothetical protein